MKDVQKTYKDISNSSTRELVLWFRLLKAIPRPRRGLQTLHLETVAEILQRFALLSKSDGQMDSFWNFERPKAACYGTEISKIETRTNNNEKIRKDWTHQSLEHFGIVLQAEGGVYLTISQVSRCTQHSNVQWKWIWTGCQTKMGMMRQGSSNQIRDEAELNKCKLSCMQAHSACDCHVTLPLCNSCLNR